LVQRRRLRQAAPPYSVRKALFLLHRSALGR